MPPPESVDTAAELRSTAQALGLTLEPGDTQRLQAYLGLLQRWNGTYNLTSVRDPGQMLVQHLADCMTVVPPLRRHAGDARVSVLDVGSGAGLPGAVIAILLPSAEVTCVDAVGKKAAFIRQVAGELELTNLHAEHGRVEQGRGRFDVVTSRAFASLRDFTELTRGRLHDHGVWMAMKGREPAAEISALPPDIEMFHVEQLSVPGLAAERCLVWMRPLPAG